VTVCASWILKKNICTSKYDFFFIFKKIIDFHLIKYSKGLKSNFVTSNVTNFDDQIAPFNDLFGCNVSKKISYNGTLFRIPFRYFLYKFIYFFVFKNCLFFFLRIKGMQSNLSEEIIDINQLIKKIETKGHNLLLFLNNVKKITIYQRKLGKISQLFQIVSNNTFDFKNFILNSSNLNNLTNSFDSAEIETKVVKNNLSSTKEETIKWLVFGSTKNIGQYQKKIGFLFVACAINNNNQQNQGKLFHFLPLNDINSSLPVNLNVNFRINSSRFIFYFLLIF
jgi:hypothetical protein